MRISMCKYSKSVGKVSLNLLNMYYVYNDIDVKLYSR